MRQLGWRTALGFIVTILLSLFAGIVLIVIVTLMCITFVKSVDQPDFGNVPLHFFGTCVALAGLFFGGQKLFHERNKPDKDRLRIGMLYLLAGIFVAVFIFTYPAYASMATPYAAHSIPLLVVTGSLVVGVLAFAVATFKTVVLLLRYFR